MASAEDTKVETAEDADASTKAASAAGAASPVAPALLRLKSTEKAGDAMGSEMRSLWSKYQDYMGDEATKAVTTSAAFAAKSEEEFAVKVSELKTQARDKLKEALLNDGTLQDLFKKYDENEDGVLSKEEVLHLMKDYLSANAEWAPETVKSTVTVTVGATEQAFALGMGDEAGDLSDEEKKQIEEAIAMQKQVMEAMLEPMITAAQTVAQAMLEDVDTFASDFFDALDKDGNGKVDKTEFMNGFVDEMATVFDPERTMKYQMLAMGDMMGGLFAGLAAAAAADEDQEDCLIM